MKRAPTVEAPRTRRRAAALVPALIALAGAGLAACGEPDCPAGSTYYEQDGVGVCLGNQTGVGVSGDQPADGSDTGDTGGGDTGDTADTADTADTGA